MLAGQVKGNLLLLSPSIKLASNQAQPRLLDARAEMQNLPSGTYLAERLSSDAQAGSLSPVPAAKREARVRRSQQARSARLSAMAIEAEFRNNKPQDQAHGNDETVNTDQQVSPSGIFKVCFDNSSPRALYSNQLSCCTQIDQGKVFGELACQSARSTCSTCWPCQKPSKSSRGEPAARCTCNPSSPSSPSSLSSSSSSSSSSLSRSLDPSASSLSGLTRLAMLNLGVAKNDPGLAEFPNKTKAAFCRSICTQSSSSDLNSRANETSVTLVDASTELSGPSNVSHDSWQQVGRRQVLDLRPPSKGESWQCTDTVSGRQLHIPSSLLAVPTAANSPLTATLLANLNQLRSNNNRNLKQRAHVGRNQASAGQKRLMHVTSTKKKGPPEEGQFRKHMNWKDIVHKFGKMPSSSRNECKLTKRLGQSHCCHLLLATLTSLFPFFSSFKGYKPSRDLVNDLLAGFTISVLHIPQGMAYGLLSGVEPIYGLYVSFVPVLVMAFMSRSRHVSYGTFAILSMVLFNTTNTIKMAIRERYPSTAQSLHSSSRIGIESEQALVITDNHQPLDQTQHNLLKELIANKPFSAPETLIDAIENVTTSDFDPLDSDTSSFVMPSNIEILSGVSFFVGCIQILMSLVNMGALTLMFSDQLVSSFTTASAIHVVTSQLSSLFDVKLPPISRGPFEAFRIWYALAIRLQEGFNYATALLSLGSILFLFIVKEFIEPKLKKRQPSLPCFPTELILMVAVIFCSWFWKFNSSYSMRIVGHIPTGLPKFNLPKPQLAFYVIQESITLALVSFAINLSLAQVYAKRFKYKVEPNHELFALGTANTVSSMFSCFPCASSLSRSAVLSQLNPKSQLSSIFSCAIVVAIICYLAPILHDLPQSTLSCIIVVALKGILCQIRDLQENWRLSKLDAFVWLFTFLAVLCIGVTYGLLLGIVASLFAIFFRLLNPSYSDLGQLPGTDIYVDKTAFMDCSEIEHVKIFRFNSPLCYLNRTMFKSPNGYSSSEVKYLIIDCSALAYCDYSGATTLVEIIEELDENSISCYLATCSLKFINMLEKMQKIELLENNIFPTIGDAVSMAKHLESRHDRVQAGFTPVVLTSSDSS